MRALLLEFAVLAGLLASFLTVRLPWPHLAAGSALAVVAGGHVLRWRRVYRATLRRRDRRRAASTTLLGAAAAAATVTGFVQQAAGDSAIPWHGATSTILILIATGHATRRLRRRRRAGHGAGDPSAHSPVRRPRGTGAHLRRPAKRYPFFSRPDIQGDPCVPPR